MLTSNVSNQALLRERARTSRRDLILALTANIVPLLGTAFLLTSIFAFGMSVHLFDVVLFAVCYFLGMIGLEVGFHRYFAHKSFKTSKPIEMLLGVLGSMSFQGGVILWTATHRRHHGNTDEPSDPHSPVAPAGSGPGRRLSQFMHAYIGWMFDAHSLKPKGWERMTPDMFRRPDLFRLHVSYAKWGVLGILIPALVGAAWYQTWQGFVSGLLWGGLLRIFVANQMYYITNSFGHLIGTRPFRRADNSRNNLLLAIPTLGLSLHNNHHEFPASASVSLRWWQPDISALVIRILELFGLVWDVRRPTRVQILEARQRYSTRHESGEKEA